MFNGKFILSFAQTQNFGDIISSSFCHIQNQVHQKILLVVSLQYSQDHYHILIYVLIVSDLDHCDALLTDLFPSFLSYILKHVYQIRLSSVYNPVVFHFIKNKGKTFIISHASQSVFLLLLVQARYIHM